MKIQNHLPRFNEDLHLELIENGWKPLKEPGSLAVSFLLSIPFMIINMLIAIGAINIFSTISFEEFGFTPDSLTITINFGFIILGEPSSDGLSFPIILLCQDTI